VGIISAPMRGLFRIFREVADRAEAELYDEDAVKAELMAAYRQLEDGSLTEEAFAEREAELVERLDEIERHRKGKGSRGKR
jgi:Gas vesicle protein G